MPDPSTMFDTQLIIDADHSETAGWEVSVRFDAESQEVGWSDMDDAALKLAVGASIAQVLIDARDHNLPPEAELPYSVGVNGDPPMRLRRFANIRDATTFIGTLEGVQDGRYYLDGPES